MKNTKSANSSKSANSPIAQGVGRRKRAVARVWLRRGSGKLRINGKDVTEYFDTPETRLDAASPLTVIKQSSRYDFVANVDGGGICSQAGAVKMGIARALVMADETTRPELRKQGMLTRDPREVERKKPGQKGARAKFQFVKR